MPDSPARPQPGSVLVFATSWCPFCQRLRRDLTQARIDFAEIDVDQDEAAAAYVESVNGGDRVVPTVLFPDGTTLTNPLAAAVQARLGG